MGPTIVFTIPVALGVSKIEDRLSWLVVFLYGFIAFVPVIRMCLVGGLLVQVYHLVLLSNLIPIVIVSAYFLRVYFLFQME